MRDVPVPFIVIKHPSKEEIRIQRGLAGDSHYRLFQCFPDWICLGGGFARFHLDEKIIEIFGKSERYGNEPNRQKTLYLLTADYPLFKVKEIEFDGRLPCA